MQLTAGHSWHSLSETEATKLLESDLEKGITTDAATERLQQFGPNVLTAKKGKGPLIRFLLQFRQPLVNHLFQTAPISLDAWIRIVAAGAIVFTMVGIEKWVQQKFKKGCKNDQYYRA